MLQISKSGREERTICDDNTIFALNGFICNSFREVDGEKDGVHLPSDWVEWSFEEYCRSSISLIQALKR